MAKYEILGTEQKLKQSASPQNTQKTSGGNFSTGDATTVPLKKEPSNPAPSPGGKFDSFGTTVKLKQDANVGWGPLKNDVTPNQVLK